MTTDILQHHDYPAYAVLCERRAALVSLFQKTRAAALLRVNVTACRAWLRRDNAYTSNRVRETDRALEREFLRDPEAAHLYSEISQLHQQLKAHRAALGITGEDQS